MREKLAVGAIICVGAAFDFIAERPVRAPVFYQRMCLEWLWRLVHDPARFARRYIVDLAYLPVLLLGQLWRSSGRRTIPATE
jgi:exopolysaccharide biosynthesis WecB/TagA/CpsF family protein